MDDIQIINLTPANIADYGVCGYKDVLKHKELKNKIAWFETYYPKRRLSGNVGVYPRPVCTPPR